MYNKKAISLIVLVITVIVISILATVTVITLNASGLIPFTENAAFKSRINTYKEELSVYHANELAKNKWYNSISLNIDITKNDENIENDDINIVTVIPSITEEDKSFFLVRNGELRISMEAGYEKVLIASELGLLTDMYEKVITEKPEETMFIYTVSNNEATITGFASGVITDTTDLIKDLVIPHEIGGLKVTAIGVSAFEYCTNIETLLIPNSVKKISSSAFYYCSGLTSVTLSKNLTLISNRAFQGCSSLKDINLPSTLNTIGTYTFYNCRNLKSIVIPEDITSIGAYTFYNCSGVTSVLIPQSISTIGNFAFYNFTSLKTINFKGTKEEWERVTIGTNNDALERANKNYNYNY